MGLSIKGVTVLLHQKTAIGLDPFGAKIYDETLVPVDNVIIEPASSDAVVSDMELFGKRLAFVLHIPKGDTHDWTDTSVDLPAVWNQTVRTYGKPLIYDPAMTPLEWNQKVKCELYE